MDNALSWGDCCEWSYERDLIGFELAAMDVIEMEAWNIFQDFWLTEHSALHWNIAGGKFLFAY